MLHSSRLLGALAVGLLAISSVCITNPAIGQTAQDSNEGLRILLLTTPGPDQAAYKLSWWGRAGRIYFIEHSENLYFWSALPDYFSGADAVLNRGILTTDTERFFARLRWFESSLSNFEAGDYDGDGLTTAQETSLDLNPFARDTDLDGLPDAYELAMRLDPLMQDSASDLDFDGVANFKDARPNDQTIGGLSINIILPNFGTTL